MITHKELVEEISQELYENDNCSALILYGSVSRNEEGDNSDIDLLVIIGDNYLQKRHEVRYGITVEYVEEHITILQKSIAEKEIPMLFALANGTVLFDKASITEKLISEAREIIKEGPPVNTKWEDNGYVTMRRHDLTEIYNDLLDVDDEMEFHYLASLLVTTAIPWLIENYNLWPQTRKKTISYLKSQCRDGYEYIEILLRSDYSLSKKRAAARSLIEYTMKKHGGILEGDGIIFRKNYT